MNNISKFSDLATANTCLSCAEQRAQNLASLGVKTVIELCVGPSLAVLESVYRKQNITVTGNDIDSRWKEYYPRGKWIIGDARDGCRERADRDTKQRARASRRTFRPH